MPKFAVYYIPGERDEIYHLGSSIVGYDVRKRKFVETLNELQEVPNFTDKWLEKARPYGFHLTITDSIDFNFGDIITIEHEINDILRCFDPKHEFTLHSHQEDFVTFWEHAVVLRYEPNAHLKVLHSALVTSIHPLGTGSGYLRRFIENPEKESMKPYHAHRILKFLSPTIFDSYSPHFTLLNPYTGGSDKELSALFTDRFRKFTEIILHSVCLLIQMVDRGNWHIHREFIIK